MRKTNSRTRITALVLAIVMLIVLLPVITLTVSAADNLLWPVQGYGLSPGDDSLWGTRWHPIDGGYKHHSGIDIGAPTGTPILAATDGVVKFAGYNGGFGNSVKLWSETSYYTGYTYYAHADLLNVKEGQTVKRGDIIAYVGSTGNSSGAHLHFETWYSWEDANYCHNPLDHSYGYDYSGSGGSTESTGTSPYPVPTRNLSRGDTGNDVKYLQWGLGKLGYDCGTIDGDFGPATESALKSFQRNNRLDVDGIFGKVSLSKMKELLNPPANYTITYNANGGSGAPGKQTKTHGVTLYLSATVPTRSGYTFLGWSTNNAATSASYLQGSGFTTNANTTLYAVWKINNGYTITYNANGGTVSSILTHSEKKLR